MSRSSGGGVLTIEAVREFVTRYGLEVGLLIFVVMPLLGMTVTIVTTIIQIRNTKRETKKQEDLIKSQGEYQLNTIKFQLAKQDEQVASRRAEADRAEQQLVCDHLVDLLWRLEGVATLQVHNLSSAPSQVKQKFDTAKKFLESMDLDPARPDRSWSHWLTHLLFQALTSYHIIINSRRNSSRDLTERHQQFLRHHDAKLIPAIIGSVYPGEPLCYKAQIAIICRKMTRESHHAGVLRPLDWEEYCAAYKGDAVFKSIADAFNKYFISVVAGSDDNSYQIVQRKATQARCSIIGLYLLKALELSTAEYNPTLPRKSEAFWGELVTFRRKELEHKPNARAWHVDVPRDVDARIERQDALGRSAHDEQPLREEGRSSILRKFFRRSSRSSITKANGAKNPTNLLAPN